MHDQVHCRELAAPNQYSPALLVFYQGCMLLLYSNILDSTLCISLTVYFSFLPDRVASVGHEIIGSNSGIDVQGATFLMNDVILEEGVVFAFSAFFRFDSRIKFQIWRPAGPLQLDHRDFQLLGEISIIPSITKDREDVSICKCKVDSPSRPGDVFMRHWTGSSLVKIITCHPFGAKPLSESILTTWQLHS